MRFFTLLSKARFCGIQLIGVFHTSSQKPFVCSNMAYHNTGAGVISTGSGGNSGGNSAGTSLELPHVSVLLTFPLAVCGLRRIQTDRKAWLTLIGRESNASSGALISVTCTTGSVNRARLLLAPVITCGRCQLVARSRHWSFRKRQWRDRAYHVNYLNKQ